MFTPVTDTGARIEYIDNWTGNINGVKETRSEVLIRIGQVIPVDGSRDFRVYYIHSKELSQKTGRGYYTDATSLVLKPGEKKTYQFKFSAVRAR